MLTEVEHVCDRVAIVDRGTLLAVNTVAELTNDVHSVRLRLTGPQHGVEDLLGRFGRVSWSDGWYTVTGTDPEAVPEMVAMLVQQGGRIYAVEPGHHTLEERFLQVLKGAAHAPAHDRVAHPA